MTNVTLFAPLAPTASNWGTTAQAGLIVAPGSTRTIVFSFSPTAALPTGSAYGGSHALSGFYVQFKYFNGTDMTTETSYFPPDGGSYEITVGDGASSVAIRSNVNATLVQQIFVDTDGVQFDQVSNEVSIFSVSDNYAGWFNEFGNSFDESWNSDSDGRSDGGQGSGSGDGSGNACPAPPGWPDGKASPLVLDLDGDGVELYAVGDYGTYFDLLGTGQANLTGWVAPDDGLLAIDTNADGFINDITELFGSADTDGFTELVSQPL